ncbi:UPF0052-domain-containing protein [Metschnikowia bicuspidata var. bicuspidata NRRL YB-4993]|uniref:UPF0052-domain-containing protein n=1 Tax=Metschnikowia bicuspidata var. bicuspidata NRRL YB-4993 TaxID=869754 RepID=A0A1A0HB08_9ASCO|nr:UPF0052-domain-containing protein [Metschnikowia bicuspidata var. bicuspidata NRRL YB-4993]OBA21196.1 UPF0052-domain-containing protein [Metschnikowia bicuspidata var. bicuspidata NRRL YB-4993]
MTISTVILSGGTATNDLVPLFSRSDFKVSYVLPILDTGGSSSEIIRVIGGPAIGDIRSRLIQLIPHHQRRLRDVLSLRLNANASVAKAQWEQIVDGSHELWHGIPNSTKEIVRSFLLHIHVELLKRSRIYAGSSPGKQFKFEFANIGNLLLTAIRLFTGSLDSAIELFMKITDIDSSSEVLPCVNTNFSYHISAFLSDGSTITGQSQISHPSMKSIYSNSKSSIESSSEPDTFGPDQQIDGLDEFHDFDDANIPSDEEIGNTPLYTHPDLKKSQLHFRKTSEIEPLLSPIKRIFYVSPYGEEICPTAQSRVLSKLLHAEIIVYSIGSLMTSITPIVILKGVGRAIAENPTKFKKRILLLNGNEDRETAGLGALDYIRVIVELAQYLIKKSGHGQVLDWTLFVTHLFYMENSKIPVDIEALENIGITCVAIKQATDGIDKYDLEDLSLNFLKLSGTGAPS